MRRSLKTWQQAARYYKNLRVLSMIFFGISSGLPFLLTLATMNIWLTQIGISSTTIGQLAFVQIPYTLKFVWSPFIDQYNIPILHQFLGKRRSWLLVMQIGLILSIVGMAQINPKENLNLFALCGFFVSLFSSTQDLILGGYRIEILKPHQQGAGSGSLWIGFRLGLLISSSGALYLSSFLDWQTIYMIMAIILLFGTSIIFFNPREKPRYRETQGVSYFSIVIDVTRNIRSKPQWFLLPLFILFYKAGDGIFGAYTPVFLSKLGFTNIDLSQGNLLGVSFAIIGGFLGGILVTRYGSIPTLKICAILQMLTCMMLVCQNFIGAYKPMIFMVMMMEHLYFGVGGAALYSFLSILSTSKYTASQFAFLCSFGSFSRIFTTWIGGWAADQMSWGYFFACVSLCGFIYLMILNKMERDSW